MKNYTWKGKWEKFQGKIKQEWDELTSDEIKATQGRKEFLIRKIQEKYDLSAERAEQQLSTLYRNLDTDD